ncbi:hypothetical protein [Granulicella sp. L46]|uniref:hypothetical protein n=1 Tax=Granulicella sp. L46 TaxID=1641865 RepID=UPI00131D9882|nr:hypothetical protein [Granulicella sp. L46]
MVKMGGLKVRTEPKLPTSSQPINISWLRVVVMGPTENEVVVPLALLKSTVPSRGVVALMKETATTPTAGKDTGDVGVTVMVCDPAEAEENTHAQETTPLSPISVAVDPPESTTLAMPVVQLVAGTPRSTITSPALAVTVQPKEDTGPATGLVQLLVIEGSTPPLTDVVKGELGF